MHVAAAHWANWVACYQLLFMDGGQEPVLKLDIEATDDTAAIASASEQSLARGVPVEVWNSEFVMRVTPFTARLLMKE